MEKYRVDLAFTSYLTYEVEADSAGDARDKAWKLYESGVEGDPSSMDPMPWHDADMAEPAGEQ
jgi:hypothetical protein